MTQASVTRPSRRAPIAVLGVPFDNLTTAETVELVAGMIASREPHYIATADVDLVVQAGRDIELRRILFDAHAVLCDGLPIVWASRRLGNPIVERLTGARLVPRLLLEAELRGWRVFLLGGSPAAASAAAANTLERHPRLRLVGAYAPPPKPLAEMNHGDLIRRVASVSPDLLFVAFGSPDQEKWIHMHYRHLGVPVCMGIGPVIDFLADGARPAPGPARRLGLEHALPALQEAQRLFRRYGADSWAFRRAVQRQVGDMRRRPKPPGPAGPAPAADPVPRGPSVATGPARLDAEGAQDFSDACLRLLEQRGLILDMSPTEFMDSTGVGALVRLRKRAREMKRDLIVSGLQPRPMAALRLMKLQSFFDCETSVESARARLGFTAPRGAPNAEVIRWSGAIVAASVHEFSEAAEARLDGLPPGARVKIDLSAVTFADSTGVGLMVALKKRAHRRHVDVVFADPVEAVSEVLKLTRLDAYLAASSE